VQILVLWITALCVVWQMITDIYKGPIFP